MGYSFEELLEIENDSEFLQFKCPKTGYLLWPLVRNQFFRQLISDLYYTSAPLLAPAPPIPRRQALSILPKVLMHNVGNGNMKGEVLIIGTGVGQFQREELWFNRINDYFALASPADTVTIESIADWRIPEPRWNSRVNYWLPWQGVITIAGHLCVRDIHIESARTMVKYAYQRAQTLLGLTISDSCLQMLIGMLSRKIARLPTTQIVYQRLLEKVEPRLVLIEEGCYGDRGIFNHIARKLGVHIAEPQHGMISGGHDAYCYAPALRNSDVYREYLPHDFLTYGKWWNEQVNVPIAKWAIGHPHYSEQREKDVILPKDKTDILILSDGIEFSLYLELAKQLAKLISNRYQVVLRPHPLERSKIYEAFPMRSIDNVTIDRHLDIYQSFASAYVVAGEVSTGLFEAIGIASKILIWETPKARFSYPRHPFASFTNAEAFAELILDPDRGALSVMQEDIWATGWQANYRRYLEHVLQGGAA